jgi:lipoprotein-anchoring transpeptidase ErfK/SrfK
VLLVAIPAVVLAALALALYLYDHSRRDLIAPGVTVGGVDVGGMRAAAAKARLDRELMATRTRWITIERGSLALTLSGTQAHLRPDVDLAVAEAVDASRGGWFVSRAVRGLFGARVDQQVPLPVSYDHRAVTGLMRRARAAIDRPAQDASVSVSSGGQLVSVRSHTGLALDRRRLAAEVNRALEDPAEPHVIRPPVRTLRPRVTTKMLSARYPAYIVVDRSDFKLNYYSHLHLAHSYPIAVGQQGLQTPAGLHTIVDKEVNPAWHVPNSSWAGSLAGQVIPPGPQDPLVARWMGIDDQGDGIHGTDEPGSIGSAASHGCIRMLVPDVIQLYSITPVGTPVYVL